MNSFFFPPNRSDASQVSTRPREWSTPDSVSVLLSSISESLERLRTRELVNLTVESNLSDAIVENIHLLSDSSVELRRSYSADLVNLNGRGVSKVIEKVTERLFVEQDSEVVQNLLQVVSDAPSIDHSTLGGVSFQLAFSGDRLVRCKALSVLSALGKLARPMVPALHLGVPQATLIGEGEVWQDTIRALDPLSELVIDSRYDSNSDRGIKNLNDAKEKLLGAVLLNTPSERVRAAASYLEDLGSMTHPERSEVFPTFVFVLSLPLDSLDPDLAVAKDLFRSACYFKEGAYLISKFRDLMKDDTASANVRNYATVAMFNIDPNLVEEAVQFFAEKIRKGDSTPTLNAISHLQGMLPSFTGRHYDVFIEQFAEVLFNSEEELHHLAAIDGLGLVRGNFDRAIRVLGQVIFNPETYSDKTRARAVRCVKVLLPRLDSKQRELAVTLIRVGAI